MFNPMPSKTEPYTVRVSFAACSFEASGTEEFCCRQLALWYGLIRSLMTSNDMTQALRTMPTPTHAQ